MKGLKCTHYWGYLSGVLLGFLFLIYTYPSKTASAIQLTDGTTRRATNTSYLKMTDGSTRQTFNATYGLADTDFQNLPANYYVDNIRLNLSNYLPANTIFTFTVHYRVKGSSTYTAGIEYFGWSSGSSWTLLNDSCVNPESSLVTNTSTWETTLTCTYTGFTNVRLDYIDNVDRTRLIRFLNPDSNQGWVNSNAQITIGYIDSRTISWNGLTEDDREWLEEHMPAGSSTADIESAIEAAREDEKSEYENQQEDVDSGAEDAGEEAEEATSTLIETSRGIIETIRDTPATNCVIRINTGNFDTGNLNLCNVPQEIRTVISSVITIPVTLAALHIAYTTVMLYLNTVRREQE